MDETLLAQMITKRKSIRSFKESPLSIDAINDILSFSLRATPLFPEIKTAFRILSRNEISCACVLSAPHYLAIYSERSPDADLNSGFMLQQTDLYLASRGIGACWLGMARPKESEFEGLPFVILLSFGAPAEELTRERKEQFHRKQIDEIASAGVVPDYIDAMRLAPSAMNKQPWYFSGDEHCCRAFSVRGRGLINLAEGWRFVDLGIALSHLYIAARAAGQTISFRREDSIPARNGAEYAISCRLSAAPRE